MRYVSLSYLRVGLGQIIGHSFDLMLMFSFTFQNLRIISETRQPRSGKLLWTYSVHVCRIGAVVVTPGLTVVWGTDFKGVGQLAQDEKLVSVATEPRPIISEGRLVLVRFWPSFGQRCPFVNVLVQGPWAIVLRCLRDDVFSRSDRTLTCTL